MIAKTIGLKMSSDPRGKVSAGRRNAEGRGEKLEYFNFDKYPEVRALYGDKPNKIWIAVTSDDIEQVLRAPFKKYVGGDFGSGKKGTCQRYCDGETCVHRLDLVVGTERYEAGKATECVCAKHGLFDLPNNERNKVACKCNVDFEAIILHPETKDRLTYHPVRFFTQSVNSAKSVLGALTGLAYITANDFKLGRPALRNVPLILMVKMVEDRNDPKVKFPVWDMVIGVGKEQLVQRLIADAPSRGWELETVERLQLMAPTQAVQIAEGNLVDRIAQRIRQAKDIKALRIISDEINNKASVGELTEEEVETLRVAGVSRQSEFIQPQST